MEVGGTIFKRRRMKTVRDSRHDITRVIFSPLSEGRTKVNTARKVMATEGIIKYMM